MVNGRAVGAGCRPVFHPTDPDVVFVAAMGPPYELFFGLGSGDFEAYIEHVIQTLIPA